MYMNDFIRALDAFDMELDHIAKNKNKNTIAIKYDNSTPCTCQCNKNDNELKDDDDGNNNTSDILDDIKQVIFNDPATIVTFSDGTKVCVKACENDKFSKEVGLVYALVKRLYANDVDENGYLKSSGLGDKINKIIKNAVDQKKIEADKKNRLAEKKQKKNKNK